MRNAELLGTGLFALLLALPAALKSDMGTPKRTLVDWKHPHVARDLADIKRDTLRVLVMRDPLTWEQRPGAMTGLEWELLERFAKHRHLRIKALPVESRDTMLMMLQDGRGDVIAAQLSTDGWAAPYTRHTQAYRRVARATAQSRMDAQASSKDSVQPPYLVSAWSSFLDSTGRLAFGEDKVQVRIVDQMPEQLLVATALGDTAPLLVSDATAAMEAKRLPLVRFGPREGRSIPLVWAVRSNAVHFRQALDTWLASAEEGAARKAMIEAYDNGLDTRGPRRSFRALTFGGDTISPFDSLFQVHADSLNWDWKLLAAVAYKESKFDTAATSKAGAGGLMQMMPTTAALMGVDQTGGVDAHIQGASRYLARLDRIWQAEIPAPAQRLKFVLAAYNAGPGHVKDAQRLAKELGLNPLRWDGNVERAIVLLNRPVYFTQACAKTGYCRGQDTYWYVRDVLNLFAWLRGKKPA